MTARPSLMRCDDNLAQCTASHVSIRVRMVRPLEVTCPSDNTNHDASCCCVELAVHKRACPAYMFDITRMSSSRIRGMPRLTMQFMMRIDQVYLR